MCADWFIKTRVVHTDYNMEPLGIVKVYRKVTSGHATVETDAFDIGGMLIHKLSVLVRIRLLE